MRVVNALLTQLDGLKRYKTALVVTTSNLTGAIDAAFVDRADIKQYVGPPGVAARYQILSSCLLELGRVALHDSSQQHRVALHSDGWPKLLSTRCADFENVTVTVL